MEKRTYSCTERSWDRTRQVHRLVFSIDCHTPTLPDLVSSWTLLRRRKRLRSSISSCRRVSPSRSCDASQCGKGIPSSVLLFSVFPPGCPRLDEQWANLRFKDLWLIQLSVISCTIYTVCMATHCEILSYWHNLRLFPFSWWTSRCRGTPSQEPAVVAKRKKTQQRWTGSARWHSTCVFLLNQYQLWIQCKQTLILLTRQSLSKNCCQRPMAKLGQSITFILSESNSPPKDVFKAIKEYNEKSTHSQIKQTKTSVMIHSFDWVWMKPARSADPLATACSQTP